MQGSEGKGGVFNNNPEEKLRNPVERWIPLLWHPSSCPCYPLFYPSLTFVFIFLFSDSFCFCAQALLKLISHLPFLSFSCHPYPLSDTVMSLHRHAFAFIPIVVSVLVI